jgi:hypothetical protein
VVFVEINDATLRTSFAAFVDARFGGSVFDRDSGLELAFPVPDMPHAVQLRLAERLLWAWNVGENVGENVGVEIEVTLTASGSHDLHGNELQRESLRLHLKR